MNQLGVSVIVTTYNWPSALDRVLSGLCAQQYKHFEVIIADDGSKEETGRVIQSWKERAPFPIKHCWHPDEGFRAAMIRNRAAALAQYDYLVFIDGDCVPLPHFVGNHAQLAEPGFFVAGNRLLLNQPFTMKALTQKIALEKLTLAKWAWVTMKRDCNRFLPLLTLPLGRLRKLAPKKWKGVKTCNLGLWRKDYIRVNGLDENYVGWGFEDSDLVIRLLRSTIKRKSGKFATGLVHLWHKEQNRAMLTDNAYRLAQTLQSTQIRAKKGFDQYCHEND
ncbi:glycosyltransferase [Candidatus Berkiella aquae]|uniref:Glycosyltransferase family 2 protein n=1 Tax=Candidatus Berkiella aquae TaxID=295108 RepID=A0A0Q9YA19_9GAMM|nr:glycosyltransferase family 2 protein [Candidatus Berkiella aquae]MCS5710136.1 glycosyltransferase family 2 protein [Candidatus Berkiella aquae]